MPIDPAPYPRPASSEPACRAVVAARLHAPELQEPLLRRLRVRVMQAGLLDDPDLIAAAARDVGLDPDELQEWCARDDVEAALQADIAAARNPLPAARALNHKLGGPAEERRYTAPSYEITSADGREVIAVPGFNPAEVYETAIANLAPELERRPKPESVEELLAWAGEPLATAEVSLVMQLSSSKTRVALSRVARPHPGGRRPLLDTRLEAVVHQPARARCDIARDRREDGGQLSGGRRALEVARRGDVLDRVV